MSQIKITNLTFSYPGSYDNIFENVSFTIDTDWKLGFTGRNGRGKTTFLNLLLGKYEYRGSITSKVDFSYFPYQIKNKEINTIDVFMKICPNVQEWQIVREISLLEVTEDVLYRPFHTLSNGEQTKLLLAALFLRENAFLLLDEPTNHLDNNTRQTLIAYLKRKTGFILVSHDRQILDNCIDHILSINKTNIEIQSGNFSSWQKNKQLQEEFEYTQNEKLTKDIVRLSETASRTEGWAEKVEKSKLHDREMSKMKGYIGHKSAKMMKRAKVIEARVDKAIEEKSGLLKNVERNEKLKLITLSYHSKRLVELNKVSINYGERPICTDISFKIEQGDRVSLSGKNGCGKSSIIKLILGKEIQHIGTVYVASQLIISYIPQDTSYLKGTLNQYANENNIDETLFKSFLRKMDFERIQFEKNMADFSEGQKKKVLIAHSLSQQAHLYIWDEPLNFVDVLSRIQIEKLILQYKPTLLFVEHDTVFNENIATKKVIL